MSLATSVTTAKISLTVLDLDRAIRFYASCLGLGLRLRVGSLHAELTAPGLVLVLVLGTGQPRAGVASAGARVVFEVASLELALAELASAGIAATRFVVQDGLARLALFRDPDGHALFLREARYGAPARAPRTIGSLPAAGGEELTER